MTNLDAFDVGNSIERTGRAVKGNAQIAGAWLGLSVSNRRKQNQQDCSLHKRTLGHSIFLLEHERSLAFSGWLIRIKGTRAV